MEPLRMTWLQAWKVDAFGEVLHRVGAVSKLDPYGDFDGDETQVIGTTCCGVMGFLVMPGLLSRLGQPRCVTCAVMAGVDPDLPGIPGNSENCGPCDAWQEDCPDG